MSEGTQMWTMRFILWLCWLSLAGSLSSPFYLHYPLQEHAYLSLGLFTNPTTCPFTEPCTIRWIHRRKIGLKLQLKSKVKSASGSAHSRNSRSYPMAKWSANFKMSFTLSKLNLKHCSAEFKVSSFCWPASCCCYHAKVKGTSICICHSSCQVGYSSHVQRKRRGGRGKKM